MKKGTLASREDFVSSLTAYVRGSESDGTDQREGYVRGLARLPESELIKLYAEVPPDMAAMLSGCVRIACVGSIMLLRAKKMPDEMVHLMNQLQQHDRAPLVATPGHPATTILNHLLSSPQGVCLYYEIAELLYWATEQPDLRAYLLLEKSQQGLATKVRETALLALAQGDVRLVSFRGDADALEQVIEGLPQDEACTLINSHLSTERQAELVQGRGDLDSAVACVVDRDVLVRALQAEVKSAYTKNSDHHGNGTPYVHLRAQMIKFRACRNDEDYLYLLEAVLDDEHTVHELLRTAIWYEAGSPKCDELDTELTPDLFLEVGLDLEVELSTIKTQLEHDELPELCFDGGDSLHDLDIDEEGTDDDTEAAEDADDESLTAHASRAVPAIGKKPIVSTPNTRQNAEDAAASLDLN